MSFQEFSKEVVPLVAELKVECKEMTKEDFDAFKKLTLERVRENNLCHKLIEAIFPLIQPTYIAS